MKLAFSTLGCPGWSWEEVYATAKDLGLNGIEIRGLADKINAVEAKVFSDENINSTIQKLKSGNMEISMFTSGACLGIDNADGYMAEAKAYIDLADKMGVNAVRVMGASLPQVIPTNMAQTEKLYKELCEYAATKKNKVYVLLETNGVYADSKVMLEIMEKTNHPNAGVLWDIHHPYRFFGEAPSVTFDRLKNYVRYVHVKDSVVVNGQVQYRMMGYGDIPIFDTLKLLNENGYEGYVSLEWLKRWCPDLQEPGIVFSHFINYMQYLISQL